MCGEHGGSYQGEDGAEKKSSLCYFLWYGDRYHLVNTSSIRFYVHTLGRMSKDCPKFFTDQILTKITLVRRCQKIEQHISQGGRGQILHMHFNIARLNL